MRAVRSRIVRVDGNESGKRQQTPVCFGRTRIVQKRRQGLFVYYSIADSTIYELCDIVCGAVGKRYDQVIKEFSGR